MSDMCGYIKDLCPYECDCDDCEVYKAIREAQEISKMKQDGTYEQYRYDEAHADDYKRNLED